MAYLSSNEPYGRVDDGIGSGLVSGALVGGAAYGGAYASLPKMKQTSPTLSMKSSGGSVTVDPKALKGMSDAQKAKMGIDQFQTSTKPSRAARLDNYLFNSGGKRAAIAGGVSVLGGALLGAGIDGMNN